MLLRAVFWIGLVTLLIPHEPDLGYGRPGEAAQAAMGVPGNLTALIASTASGDGSAAPGSLSVLDSVHTVALRSMAEVKADLKANGHPLRLR